MSDFPSDSDTDRARALERREEESIARMRALLDRPLSEADLRANTELVAAQAEARRTRMESVLVFEIGDERLGIAAEESHRVVPSSVVRRVPHRTNEVFAGIANIGGELTLVAHAGSAFGIAAGARWAFAVDRVEGVRRMDADAALPPPATVRHACDGCTRAIAEIAPLDGRANALVGLLDTARVAALFARSLA